jgi:hypothetical protein
MVIAVIALVCALTGTAWAALGKNSVGSKQLKKNAITTAKIKKEAVTAAKVKKGTLTGAQINLAKLGTVPSAQLANSIPPAEPTHLVGAPGEPGFENGSSNVGATGPLKVNSVGFYKDHEGIVHLEGVAKVGPGTGIVPIFTLPPGYRPAASTVLIFEQVKEAAAIVAGSNTAVETLDLSGKVVGAAGKSAVLDGITFRAAS